MAHRIAVLGAFGVVGRGLLRCFSEDGRYEATGVCRNQGQRDELEAAGLRARVFALEDQELPEFLAQFDVVVNAIRPRGSIAEWRKVEGQIAALLDHLPGRVTMVHLSSVSIFAQMYANAEAELKRPSGRDTHARNKLYAERRLMNSVRRNKRRLVLARVGHVWGPGQLWSLKILSRLRDGRTQLVGDGAAPSNGVHIRTLANTLTMAMDGGSDVVMGNAIDQPNWSWRRLFDFHAKAFGLPPMNPADEAWSRSYETRERKRFLDPLAGRLVREVVEWAAGIPRGFVRSCPAASEAASRLLLAVGAESLEERLRRRMNPGGKWAMHKQAQPPQRFDFWMIGDPTPGPTLPSIASPGEREKEELRDWAAGLADEEKARFHV